MNDNDPSSTRALIEYVPPTRQRARTRFNLFRVPYDQPIGIVLLHGGAWGVIGGIAAGLSIWVGISLDRRIPPPKPVTFHVQDTQGRVTTPVAADGCTYVDFTDDAGKTRHILVDAVDDDGQPVEGNIYDYCPRYQP